MTTRHTRYRGFALGLAAALALAAAPAGLTAHAATLQLQGHQDITATVTISATLTPGALAALAPGERYLTYAEARQRYTLRYPAAWRTAAIASPLPASVAGYRFPPTIVVFGDPNGPTSDSVSVVTATPPPTAGPRALRAIERTLLLTGSQPLGAIAYGTRRIHGVTYQTARLRVKTGTAPQQQTVIGAVRAGTAYFFIGQVDQHTSLTARDTGRIEQLYESITVR